MLSTLWERGTSPCSSLRSYALAGMTLTLVFLMSMARMAQADTIFTPNTVAESAANSGLSSVFNTSARTYMGYIDTSQFASLTGPIQITGMQFRLAIGTNSGVSGSWPPQGLTFSDYSIQLARGSTAVEAAGGFPDPTAVFSSNQNSSTVVNVRSGSLTLAANSFVQDGGTTGTHSFGQVISFATPYTYTPGQSLTYLINQSGYGTSTGVAQAYFASTDYAANVADALVNTAGENATTPTNYSQPLYVQFQYSVAAVPETATYVSLAVMMGLGGLSLHLRRRVRQ